MLRRVKMWAAIGLAATSASWAVAFQKEGAAPAVKAAVAPAAPATAAPSTTAPAAPAKPATATLGPAATTPVPRDEKWKVRHDKFNEQAKKGGYDLLFIGDSITQGWEGAGKEVWAKRYAPRKALNLGIGGDRTQHVIWRLQNGNLEGIAPKAAVIMIGTNNSGSDSAEDIAAGVAAVVKTLRDKQPQVKVLLLAVFPRGDKPDGNRKRLLEKLEKVNTTIAKLSDGKNVFFLDIGPKFLATDGSIPKEIMPDFLHLSPKGYEIWGDAIEDELKKLLGE